MTYRILTSLFAAALMSSAALAQTTTTTTTTITTEQSGKIKSYFMKEKPKSVKVQESVTVGATLPAAVELHAFPSDVGVTQYRYTMINDRAVLVEPSTRKIIQIIE